MKNNAFGRSGRFRYIVCASLLALAACSSSSSGSTSGAGGNGTGSGLFAAAHRRQDLGDFVARLRLFGGGLAQLIGDRRGVLGSLDDFAGSTPLFTHRLSDLVGDLLHLGRRLHDGFVGDPLLQHRQRIGRRRPGRRQHRLSAVARPPHSNRDRPPQATDIVVGICGQSI